MRAAPPAGLAAIEPRLRCPDPTAHVLVEAHVEVRSALKQARSAWQAADGITLRTHDFPAANSLTAAAQTTALTLTNAPAGNSQYVAHFNVRITPVVPGAGTNTHEVVVALEVDDGGGYVEYDRWIYRVLRRAGESAAAVTWPHEQLAARVTGLGATDTVRLRIVAATGPGGWSFAVHGFNLATDLDLTNGVTYHTGSAVDFLVDGVELADLVQTKISHGASDGFITDLDGPPGVQAASPFLVARIVWGKDDPADMPIDRIIAFLHPKQDGGQPKTVATWVCQPFAIRKGIAGQPPAMIDITPLASPVAVPAGEGVSAADVAFRWRDLTFSFGGSRITVPTRPRPKRVTPWFPAPSLGIELDSSPTTLIFFWALKDDGTPATNVGLGHDSGTTSVSSGSRRLRTVRVTRIAEGTGLAGYYLMELPVLGVDASRPAPRIKVESGSYVNAKLEWTGGGNRLDLGATPTADVEFVGLAEIPPGAAAIFEVLKDGGAAGTDADWRAFTDGMLVGDPALPNVTKRQTYEVRVRMTTNAGGDLTPKVVALGVREVTRRDLSDIASVVRVAWAVDPVTCRAEVPEAVIQVLHDGERDFRDRISELLSDYDIGQLKFRVFVGDPDRPRSEWQHVEDFLIDDYTLGAAAVTIQGLAPLVLLRGRVPKFDTTTQDRTTLRFANVTPKTAADGILDDHLAVPARYRGPGIEDAGPLVSKTLTDHDGKTELDALAFLTGRAWVASQGRIKAVDLYGDAAVVAEFPSEEIAPLTITPGFRQRVPEFFVAWNWNEESGSFDAEVRFFHTSAIDRLGLGRVDPPRSLEEGIAQWITTEQHARQVADRHGGFFGTGLLLWSFRSAVPYPELELGDCVRVQTERFVARDPIGSRALRGALWATARVVGVHDALGTEFTVWVRSYADIVGVGVAGEGLGAEPLLTAQIDSLPGQPQNAVVRLRCRVETATIRYAYLAVGTAVPARSTSASVWTTYSSPVTLERDASVAKKLAVFADERGTWSPIQVFEVGPDKTPTILNLVGSQTGADPNITVKFTGTFDADVREVEWYLRVGNWPTGDSSQGGTLSRTYFIARKPITALLSGVSATGAVVPGALSEQIGGGGGVVDHPATVYCIAVPVDVDGNAGPRKEVSYATTGGTPASIQPITHSQDYAGDDCDTPHRIDIDSTPNGSVTDTHTVRYFVTINGDRFFIDENGSPSSAPDRNAIEVPCYPDNSPGQGQLELVYDFELWDGVPGASNLVESGVFGSGENFKGVVCGAP